MKTRAAGQVGAVLRQQVEIFGGSGISLHSLWRAAGEPPEGEPGAWSALAEPVLKGLSAYLAGLRRWPNRLLGDPPVLWTWSAESSEPWRTGDLMSNAWVAELYAAYLDGAE